ncbi:DinB family protein [Nocardia asiatica]
MTGCGVDRGGIAAELDRARRTLRQLVASADDAGLDRRSEGTRWTNEQLLFHMVFGFMVVLRLLPLVRLFGRLPPRISAIYARLLNAGTAPFHAVNYLGSCAAALVYNRRRMTGKCDRVIAALQRKLASEPEANFALAMSFPTRWDPLFTEVMTLQDVYRYPVRHFDFHARQLSLEPDLQTG